VIASAPGRTRPVEAARPVVFTSRFGIGIGRTSSSRDGDRSRHPPRAPRRGRG